MLKAFLFDATGADREVDLTPEVVRDLNDNQLLWIDLVGRTEGDVTLLANVCSLGEKAAADMREPLRQNSLHNYGTFFRCSVVALVMANAKVPLKIPKRVRLDFLVGPNWMATAADVGLNFLAEFRNQDRAETFVGQLNAATLAAALLNANLTTYLDGLEELESTLDSLDVQLLAKGSTDDGLLTRIVEGRRYIAALRRSLTPQRAVFYGLARPDFAPIANSEVAGHFTALEARFERVVDSLEHGRDLVQGSFELFTTRIAENTNILVRRLTFFGITLGAIGAVAGVFGMNFQTPYTQSGVIGFWWVVASVLSISAAASLWARWRNWI